MIRVAILTTDNREHYRDYSEPQPHFGAAPEALLQGMTSLLELEVHVVSCLRQPVSSPEKLAPNIWYHPLTVPQAGWLRTAYQGCIRAVRRKLRDIRPDLVHGQGTEKDCAICAVFSGFPNVLTIHGNIAELARLSGARFGDYHWCSARLENFVLKRTRGVFCNSQYTEDLVRPRAPRIWRVPNPVRQEFFVPFGPVTSPPRPLLLNVGTLSRNKRQLELLDVAQALHKRGLDFELRFLGVAAQDDPYAVEFRKRIKEVAQAGYASYEGFKSVGDLVACLDRASALIHFSVAESFGLVVAEALARNLKFFGSRAGGVLDIVAGAEGAELFAIDDWRGLAAAIERWIRSGCPKPTSTAALMRQRYWPEVIARRHLEIYREVLSKPS
jgi:glycosyltransferase involved in cell wall biosynthesis